MRRLRKINRSFNRCIGNPGKRPISAHFEKLISFILIETLLLSNPVASYNSQVARYIIMQKFNLSRKLFDFEEQDSDHSADSIIYISSDSEEAVSDSRDSEWCRDTEALINRIDHEVRSIPIPIGGRIKTVEGLDDDMVADPSNSHPGPFSTPKLSLKYFDKKMDYSPSRKVEKTKIGLCKNLLPVLESNMSPPRMREGLHKTFLSCILWIWASTHLTILT